MKLEFTALTPAELKLTGKFILDLAVIREATEVGVSTGDAVRRTSEQEPEKVTAHPEADTRQDGKPEALGAPYGEPEKPKRTRKTKTEAVVEERLEQVAEAVEVNVDTDEVVTEEAPAESPHTTEDVRAALQNFVGKHGMPDALTLLSTFGASRVSELKPEQFAEFIEKASV